jgi:aspartyl-tRNA(Asn)/glutamyl-tRNA(Gln) amidotransferase subunit A
MPILNNNHDQLVKKIDVILTLIKDEPKKFESVFTELFHQDFGKALNYINSLDSGFLKGLVVSVKDLFDVKGYKTKGGSKFLDNQTTIIDADCIALIREAGGFLLGHTNMTELAYSGLGINPHYGTPDNPVYKGSIPGGSTSGGAVSIALNIADITIGTDTGGSTRIPAAFTGITGFKPTQDNISRTGCLTLSSSLDSVGLMAKNVELCKIGYKVMKDKKKISQKSNVKNLKFIIPSNFGFENIEPDVELAFNLAKKRVIDQGYNIIEERLSILETYKNIPLWQFAAVECQSEYLEAYTQNKHLIDPNILKRMDRANNVTAVEYKLLLKIRKEMIREFNSFLGKNFLLMPTVTIKPPLLKKCDNEEFYDKVNLITLKNTSLANYMNGCSLSLPYFINKEPIGIMLNGSTNNDDNLLEIGSIFERILST